MLRTTLAILALLGAGTFTSTASASDATVGKAHPHHQAVGKKHHHKHAHHKHHKKT